MKNLVQDGNAMDYVVAGAEIKSGDLRVVGDTAVVAVTDGKVGDIIAARVFGVFELPKTGGAIAQGQTVHTAGDSVVGGSGEGTKPIGKAMEAAAAGEGTVLVRLNV